MRYSIGWKCFSGSFVENIKNEAQICARSFFHLHIDRLLKCFRSDESISLFRYMLKIGVNGSCKKNESIKPTHSLSLALIQSHLLFGILYSTQEFNRYVFYMFLNIVPKKILLENFFLSRFADIIYVRVWQDERIEKRRRWRIRICVMFGWYSLWVIFSDLGTEKYDSSFDVGFFFFSCQSCEKRRKRKGNEQLRGIAITHIYI